MDAGGIEPDTMRTLLGPSVTAPQLSKYRLDSLFVATVQPALLATPKPNRALLRVHALLRRACAARRRAKQAGHGMATRKAWRVQQKIGERKIAVAQVHPQELQQPAVPPRQKPASLSNLG